MSDTAAESEWNAGVFYELPHSIHSIPGGIQVMCPSLSLFCSFISWEDRILLGVGRANQGLTQTRYFQLSIIIFQIPYNLYGIPKKYFIE